MLTAVMLGQDSTGQRITFIVIGLLLAALALAILTAWYYRVTDPGPKRSRIAENSNKSPGGGTRTDSSPDPESGPGWRKRLTGFNVPDADAKAAKEAKIAQKAQKAEAKAQSRAATQKATAPVETEALPVDPQSSGYLPDAPETVSLEGGYYLDLTEVQRSDEPQTNVGSLNSLDLRQPAPLVDPHEQPVASVPAFDEPLDEQVRQQAAPPTQPTDRGLSFDDWLAGVEAIED